MSIPLPLPVEQLIQKICSTQNQPPLTDKTRQRLDFVGEEIALSILNRIDQRININKSFDGIVIWLMDKYFSGSPKNRLNHSPITPPVNSGRVGDDAMSTSPPSYPSSPTAQFQQNFSPRTPPKTRTVRLMPDGTSREVLEQLPVNHSSSPHRQIYLNHSPYTPGGGARSVPLMQSLDNVGEIEASPVRNLQIPFLTPVEVEMEEKFSEQMVALGELEFRKAFLILNYIGLRKLEEVITAEQIRGIRDLPMRDFESEVWNLLRGNVNISISDRCKVLDWESTKTYTYHCHVFSNGDLRFKGPFLEATKTHLHRVIGDDNVLVVKFVVDSERTSYSNGQYYTAFRKVLKEGIPLGLRRYRFFVFKDGGNEAKKKDKNQKTTSSVRSIFVRMESKAALDANQDYVLAGKTIQEARGLFMHVHTLLPNISKYMIRLSLVLSRTSKLDIDLEKVNVDVIDDIYCQDADGEIVIDKDGKPCIHTDGTGFISADLAVKCPKNVFHGSYPDEGNSEVKLLDIAEPDSRFLEPPLLIQCRLYHNGLAAKGILLVNKKLENTIQVRNSMVKVEVDQTSSIRSMNSLEVVSTSNKPRRKAALSRYLIALLRCGGVPEHFFMDALKNALEDAQSVFSNKRAALRVSLNCGTMDELSAASAILSGIPLEETYLQHRLLIMSNLEKAGLRAGRIPIDDCYYLMGTADPTGILERNEVCIILDNGQISGEVLVYRHPGLHFGDIHILTAKYVKELEGFVGDAKYGIFFPCKGPRSLSDEMGGGDLDGDSYFISKNPQLLHYFKDTSPRWESKSPPKSPSNKRKSELSDAKLEEELSNLLLKSTRWESKSPPKSPSNKRKSELSDAKLEEELSNLLLKSTFQPNFAIGVAADSWMAIMDKYLTEDCLEEKKIKEEKLIRLIDIYYDALDAPKNSGGKIEVPQELRARELPHYLEKGEKSFKSTSVLGKIYDYVKSHGEEKYSSEEIQIQMLPCFMVETREVEYYKRKWRNLYDRYRRDMATALNNKKQEGNNHLYDRYDNQQGGENNNQAADDVIKIYKQELYGAAEFELSERPLKDIYDEAVAVYQVTYEYAIKVKEVGKCGFAWKVAGTALCKFYASESGEKYLCCALSVLKELFG